jgi:cytochrome c oxidase cbb3-type subunit 1
LPAYESAPLGFWTLMVVGGWTGGRHLIGGPVPAWISTVAVVASALLFFHYLVIALNFRRPLLGAEGTAAKFLRFGVVSYLLVGVLELVTSFRAVAVETQFTFLSTALEQLGLYGGISMMFFGALYYMVPRLAGEGWSFPTLATGHRVLAGLGITLLVATLAAAGWTQASDLLNAKVTFGDMVSHLRVALLLNTAAHGILLTANLLLVVNFFRTACSCCESAVASNPFRQSAKVEAHAS